jgi:hypothetical protein
LVFASSHASPFTRKAESTARFVRIAVSPDAIVTDANLVAVS